MFYGRLPKVDYMILCSRLGLVRREEQREIKEVNGCGVVPPRCQGSSCQLLHLAPWPNARWSSFFFPRRWLKGTQQRTKRWAMKVERAIKSEHSHNFQRFTDHVEKMFHNPSFLRIIKTCHSIKQWFSSPFSFEKFGLKYLKIRRWAAYKMLLIFQKKNRQQRYSKHLCVKNLYFLRWVRFYLNFFPILCI